jgi:hypothetical protein
MKKFYIYDVTISKPDYVLFDSVPQLVNYLEGYIQRALRKTRKQFMYEMSEIGHGYDDNAGANFTQLLSEYANIGVIQNGQPTKCDVHRAVAYNQEEYGH